MTNILYHKNQVLNVTIMWHFSIIHFNTLKQHAEIGYLITYFCRNWVSDYTCIFFEYKIFLTATRGLEIFSKIFPFNSQKTDSASHLTNFNDHIS